MRAVLQKLLKSLSRSDSGDSVLSKGHDEDIFGLFCLNVETSGRDDEIYHKDINPTRLLSIEMLIGYFKENNGPAYDINGHKGKVVGAVYNEFTGAGNLRSKTIPFHEFVGIGMPLRARLETKLVPVE